MSFFDPDDLHSEEPQTPVIAKSFAEDNFEELDMSDLEILANKKKMVKPDQELSVASLIADAQESSPKKSSKRSSNKSRSNNRDRLSTVSDIYDTEAIIKEKQKQASRENRNEKIRREKSEFLYKLHQIGSRNKKGVEVAKLDMSHTLDDLKNEYSRVTTTLENERMVKFCKQILLMGVQGTEMLNNKFDPIGVDLDGWSESMGYSMENQDYDEVLGELYEKYKGAGQMSPEIKLLFMIIGSATMFTVTKKISKMEPSAGLGGLFGNLAGNMMGATAPIPTPTPRPTPTFKSSPQNRRQMPAPAPFAYSIPTPMELNQNRTTGNPQPLSPLDSSSEDSDYTPSKLKGPNDNESINIESILQTMKATKQNKQNIDLENEKVVGEADQEIRKIEPKIVPKKRGRPKKNVLKT